MASAALLSVTLVPALMIVCVGVDRSGAKESDQSFPIWVYRPVIAGVMRAKVLVIYRLTGHSCGHDMARATAGYRSMPSLNEGTLLYMPTTLPGISVTKAAELLQTQDKIIRSFQEVASVYGKAGRATTAPIRHRRRCLKQSSI